MASGERSTDKRGSLSPDEEEIVTHMQGNAATLPSPGTSVRALMLKVDLRVLPVLCVLYFFAFLDR